jgi:hypothetical protein
MAKAVLISLLLGYVTCELIGAIDYLPYSPIRVAVTDALSLPGGLISAPFFPQGIHSATGAEYWPIVAFLGNLLFYAALWFGVLVLLKRRRARKPVPPSEHVS